MGRRNGRAPSHQSLSNYAERQTNWKRFCRNAIIGQVFMRNNKRTPLQRKWSLHGDDRYLFFLCSHVVPPAGPAFGGEDISPHVCCWRTSVFHLRNRLLTLPGASALRNPCASHVCSWRTPVFHLRNRLLTLPGGPLDPLDQYRNRKKIENNFVYGIFLIYITIVSLYTTI